MADIRYFEEGYLEQGYFVYTADAQADISANAALSCDVEVVVAPQEASADLSVAATLDIQGGITFEAQSDMSAAFTPTLTANAQKTGEVLVITSFALTADFDLTKASDITLDTIVNLSLQADKLVDSTSDITSAFALSLDANKILEIQTDTTAQFALNTQAEKILETTSDMVASFALSLDANKILETTSDITSAFALSLDANKILETTSDMVASFAINADLGILKESIITLSAAFTPTLSANAQKNGEVLITPAFAFTADLGIIKPLSSNLSVQATQTVNISLTSEVIINADVFANCALSGNVNRNIDSAVSVVAQTTATGQRFRDIAQSSSAQFIITAQPERIVQASADLSTSVNITNALSVIAENVITLNAAFIPTLSANAQKNGEVLITPAFAFTANIGNIKQLASDLIAQTAQTVQVNLTTDATTDLNVIANSITTFERIRNVAQSSSAQFTANIDIGAIRTAQISMTPSFAPSITVQAQKTGEVLILSSATLGASLNTVFDNAADMSANGTLVNFTTFNPDNPDPNQDPSVIHGDSANLQTQTTVSVIVDVVREFDTAFTVSSTFVPDTAIVQEFTVNLDLQATIGNGLDYSIDLVGTPIAINENYALTYTTAGNGAVYIYSLPELTLYNTINGPGSAISPAPPWPRDVAINDNNLIVIGGPDVFGTNELRLYDIDGNLQWNYPEYGSKVAINSEFVYGASPTGSLPNTIAVVDIATGNLETSISPTLTATVMEYFNVPYDLGFGTSPSVTGEFNIVWEYFDPTWLPRWKIISSSGFQIGDQIVTYYKHLGGEDVFNSYIVLTVSGVTGAGEITNFGTSYSGNLPPTSNHTNYFGTSLKVSGEYLLVGDSEVDNYQYPNENKEKGALYVYKNHSLTGGVFHPDQPDSVNGNLGIYTDIDYPNAVSSDVYYNNEGRIYTFTITPQGAISLNSKIDNPNYYSNSNTNEFYGIHLAVNGDTLVSGNRYEESPETDSGVVYVQKLDGSLLAVIENPNTHSTPDGDYFGSTVLANSSRIVTSAITEDPPTLYSFATPIFGTILPFEWQASLIANSQLTVTTGELKETGANTSTTVNLTCDFTRVVEAEIDLAPAFTASTNVVAQRVGEITTSTTATLTIDSAVTSVANADLATIATLDVDFDIIIIGASINAGEFTLGCDFEIGKFASANLVVSSSVTAILTKYSLVLPDEITYVVPRETRAYTIPYETREYTVGD